MKEPHERLQDARRNAGFKEAAEAARAYGWNETTYTSHENGIRGLKPAVAERYAKAFRVAPEWITFGSGKSKRKEPERAFNVPLVGYVGAGAQANFTPPGELGEVDAPGGSSEETVAVEIRGESLGTFFDRWLVFYDDVRRPVTPDLLNRLCVVGLDDGRVLIKKVQRSKTRGLYHLLSQTEDPILDVSIEWAAKVKSMVPR